MENEIEAIWSEDRFGFSKNMGAREVILAFRKVKKKLRRLSLYI